MTEPTPLQLTMWSPPSPPSILGPANEAALVFGIAQDMVTEAGGFMQALQSAGYFAAPTVTVSMPTISDAPRALTTTMPNLVDVAWNVPAAPGAFSQLAPNVANFLPGPFTGAAPSLTFQSMPTKDYGSAPSAPGIDLNYTMPTLSVSLPQAPNLLTLDTVQFNGVSIPSFDVSVPALTLAQPNIVPYIEGAQFTSALLDQLNVDLLRAIEEGVWTGLPGSVETALWDRAREREFRAQADALADLERMEALGYALPPGVWLDARIKIQTETENTNVGSSREIMIKQAELNLENITKARELAVNLEAKLMDYANSVAQRAFESAKFTAEAAIQIYTANVEAYKANLEAFRVEAQVYETQMRGAQVQVDIYKAELEAEKTKVEMNTALVQQYEAASRVQMMFVEIYKAELGAIETQANLQKIVVEAFGEQIKAYVGQVNAYTAEIEGYKAQIESQTAVENVYKTQVEAYAATVQAGAAEANATIEGFKAQISAYSAGLDAYRAQIQSMGEQARAASEYNTAAAEVYKAEVQGLSSYNDTVAKEWESAMSISEKIAEVQVSAAKANGDLAIAAKNITVEAARGGAAVAAQLGAAALNAVHYSNSSSWSSAQSISQATSQSNSYSGVDSYSQSVSA